MQTTLSAVVTPMPAITTTNVKYAGIPRY